MMEGKQKTKKMPRSVFNLLHLLRIRIFSVKSMKPLAILSYHRDTAYGLDFSRNDNWLIGSSQDNRISLWSIF